MESGNGVGMRKPVLECSNVCIVQKETKLPVKVRFRYLKNACCILYAGEPQE